jgi:hypothetical protein
MLLRALAYLPRLNMERTGTLFDFAVDARTRTNTVPADPLQRSMLHNRHSGK